MDWYNNSENIYPYSVNVAIDCTKSRYYCCPYEKNGLRNTMWAICRRWGSFLFPPHGALPHGAFAGGADIAAVARRVSRVGTHDAIDRATALAVACLRRAFTLPNFSSKVLKRSPTHLLLYEYQQRMPCFWFFPRFLDVHFVRLRSCAVLWMFSEPFTMLCMAHSSSTNA